MKSHGKKAFLFLLFKTECNNNLTNELVCRLRLAELKIHCSLFQSQMSIKSSKRGCDRIENDETGERLLIRCVLDFILTIQQPCKHKFG